MKLSIRKSSAETDRNKLIKEGYGEIADYVPTKDANEIVKRVNMFDELVDELEKISMCIKNTPAIGDLDLLKLRAREIDYLVDKTKGE